MAKVCPVCGDEVVYIKSLTQPDGMYMCSTCRMVLPPSRAVEKVNTVSVEVRGEIRIPFTITLYNQPRLPSWEDTEDTIIEYVEDNMGMDKILEEAHGTYEPDCIGNAYIDVEEVIES